MSKTEKSYGWCQKCGALVFGNLKCHKCDGKVKTFCEDMELFTLKQQRDDLLAVCSRMMVGITKKSIPNCDWYEGIEVDGADEAEAAIAKCET